MDKPLLTLDNVSKYYVNGNNVVTGLQEVSLSLRRGEFVAVTGESGSGKSTLGRVLAGIAPYESGEMLLESGTTSHYDTEDWECYRRERVSFISQDYGILPGATVWDHVLSALRLSGIPKPQWQERGRQILETVELWELRKRRGGKLSSGQKQRLAIARALAKPCPILVADEPTGNLDPQNSRKVLELLAHAAGERLVILITHEFDEAEPFVTRHISLHDGRVIADARLRPAARPATLPVRAGKDRGLSRYVASLQLRSRPVWTGLVLLCFVLTAFAVFVFLGSFLGAVDDTDTRIYRSEAFLNGDRNRIAVVRKDGAAMDGEDYRRILAMEYVRLLEPYGYVRDMYCAYREDIDYAIHNTLRNIGSSVDPVYYQASSVEIRKSDSFAQTVPLTAEGVIFLTAGELPQRLDQVVAVGGPELLGQTMTVYFQDSRSWSASEWIRLEVTVVGVTDLGTGLYLHEDAGRMLTYASRMAGAAYMPWYPQVYSRISYQDYRDYTTKVRFHTDCIPTDDAVLRSLGEDECLISHDAYLQRTEGLYTEQTLFEYLYESGYWAERYHIMGIHDSTIPELLAVSQETFRSIMEADLDCLTDQVSLTITDHAYTDRVIEALDRAGYYAVSPFVIGSVEVDEGLAAKREQTLKFSMAALAAVLLLQLLLLRALFSVQNASYGILSGLGLSWGSAMGSMVLQVLLLLIPGQLLCGGLIWLLCRMDVEQIGNVSKYLTLEGWLLVSLVHIAGSALSAGAVLHKLRREVYPASKRIVDLALESEEGNGND